MCAPPATQFPHAPISFGKVRRARSSASLSLAGLPMTSQADFQVTAAALALLSSKKLGAAALRDLLLATPAATSSDLLDAANIKLGGLAASLSTALRTLESGLAHGIAPVPISSAL